MSKGLVRDTVVNRVYGEHEQRLERGEKHVDGEFVYVGTYPSGPNTTPDSPPFKNSWAADTTDPPRFRWLLSGTPEIRGKWKNGADDTVVFTLPTKTRPDNEYTIPYIGVGTQAGSIRVGTNGDVTWHPPCGGAGPGGKYETTILKSSLKGWWRLGEHPSEADADTTDFEFANSAPGYGAYPLILDVHDALYVDGEGPSSLTASDDGAIINPTTANKIFTPTASYGGFFGQNYPWTLCCWFLPGFIESDDPPSDGAAGAFGLVCGTILMDITGSVNHGIGLVWQPHTFTPSPSKPTPPAGFSGPSLRVYRKGPSGSTEFKIPIPNAGALKTNWHATHDYANTDPNIVFFLFKVRNPYFPLGGWLAEPWIHIAVSYDGSNIRTYRDGIIDQTVSSAFSMGNQYGDKNDPGNLGPPMRIVHTAFDTGITEYNGYLTGGIDEVMLFDVALSDAEIYEIATLR